MRHSVLVLSGLLAVSGCAHAQNAGAGVQNPGFEDNLAGWTVREKVPMTTVRAESAHAEKMGLHVEDADETNGSSALSSPVAVTANQALKLSFWVRSADSGKAGVMLWFYGVDRKVMPKPQPVAPIRGNGDWQQVSIDATAPEGAASVAIWVHSYSGAKTSIDLDDFSLTAGDGTALAAAPALPARPVSSAPAAAKAPMESKVLGVARTSPPYIVLKTDDFKVTNGNVHPRWIRLTDFLTERKIHASIGIICDSLEINNPKAYQWVKDKQASGLIEFWCHGYDHKQWDENGKTLEEFKGTPFEQQKEHLEKCEQLAKEKLGFAFTTFGAPFNAEDENTVKALQEIPDFKVVLYGNPKMPGGKIVLDRIFQVNIEQPTFKPNFEKFVEGYNKNPQRDYFVIQGHPTHWDDAGWNNFVKIIDFLTEQKAVFVTPSEYVKVKGLVGQ